jgi:predicted AAA+ superfamily ATPase
MENIPNTESLSFEKVWLMFQETDKKFQETKQLLEHSSLETDKKFQETNKKFQETDHQMKNLMKKMSEAESRWSRFVEALAEGSLIRLLKSRNINVKGTAQREKSFYNNRQYEIDIIAKNGNDIVVVEVKTTLRPKDVKEFVRELLVFREAFPDYSQKNIYGAVAYISVEGEAALYAAKKGLFVIKSAGEGGILQNEIDFKPRIW